MNFIDDWPIILLVVTVNQTLPLKWEEEEEVVVVVAGVGVEKELNRFGDPAEQPVVLPYRFQKMKPIIDSKAMEKRQDKPLKDNDDHLWVVELVLPYCYTQQHWQQRLHHKHGNLHHNHNP